MVYGACAAEAVSALRSSIYIYHDVRLLLRLQVVALYTAKTMLSVGFLPLKSKPYKF